MGLSYTLCMLGLVLSSYSHAYIRPCCSSPSQALRRAPRPSRRPRPRATPQGALSPPRHRAAIPQEAVTSPRREPPRRGTEARPRRAALSRRPGLGSAGKGGLWQAEASCLPGAGADLLYIPGRGLPNGFRVRSGKSWNPMVNDFYFWQQYVTWPTSYIWRNVVLNAVRIYGSPAASCSYGHETPKIFVM